MGKGADIIDRLACAAMRMQRRRRPVSPPRSRRRPPGAPEALPVTPDRPLDLSGGAAAAMEFDT